MSTKTCLFDVQMITLLMCLPSSISILTPLAITPVLQTLDITVKMALISRAITTRVYLKTIPLFNFSKT